MRRVTYSAPERAELRSSRRYRLDFDSQCTPLPDSSSFVCKVLDMSGSGASWRVREFSIQVRTSNSPWTGRVL